MTAMPQIVWRAVQRYLVCIAASMLIWETLQLPMYTLWSEASWPQLAYAVLHCTAGDIAIALTSLVIAVLIANRDWPRSLTAGMIFVLTAAGLGYTIYSEASNLAHGTWAYSVSMPTLPVVGTGIAPMLQWLILPPLALFITNRLGRDIRDPRKANEANVTLKIGESR